MPKIIPGLREKILGETLVMMDDPGTAVLEMKTLAKRLDIGVGTLYNYFPGKAALLKNLLIDLWTETFRNLRNLDTTFEPPIREANKILLRDVKRRHTLFTNLAAAQVNRSETIKLYNELTKEDSQERNWIPGTLGSLLASWADFSDTDEAWMRKGQCWLATLRAMVKEGPDEIKTIIFMENLTRWFITKE